MAELWVCYYFSTFVLIFGGSKKPFSIFSADFIVDMPLMQNLCPNLSVCFVFYPLNALYVQPIAIYLESFAPLKNY